MCVLNTHFWKYVWHHSLSCNSFIISAGPEMSIFAKLVSIVNISKRAEVLSRVILGWNWSSAHCINAITIFRITVGQNIWIWDISYCNLKTYSFFLWKCKRTQTCQFKKCWFARSKNCQNDGMNQSRGLW